jgi:hypothetical protein
MEAWRATVQGSRIARLVEIRIKYTTVEIVAACPASLY